jgi:hypothetical protein
MPKISKQSLQNVFVSGDGFVTKTELSRILKQVYVESVDPNTSANLEVFEVISLETPKVKGRYVFSNQGDSVDELVSFLPATSNITQPPLIGELWLGFKFKKEHFYISRLSDSNVSVNYQRVGQSTPTLLDNKTNNETRSDVKSRPYGNVFKPNISVSNQLLQSSLEGQTLIQGRYNNYIQLGAKEQEGFGSEKNYIKLSNQETYIDMENSLRLSTSSQQYSELLDMNYDKTSGKVSRYLLSGKGKEDKPYLDLDWEGPTLWANSGRVLITASEDDIAIFAKKSVRIKGERIQIANDGGGVEVKAKTIVNDISEEDGKIINATKEGIPFPELNMSGFLKQTMGIQKLFQALTLGVPKLSNPATLPSGVKDIVKGLEGAKNFIEATLNLEFLEKEILTTKTPEEIAASLPIPAGFKNIVGDIQTFSEGIDENIKKLEKVVSDNAPLLENAQLINNALESNDRTAILNTLESVPSDILQSIPGGEDTLSMFKSSKLEEKDIIKARENGAFVQIENYLSETATGENDLELMKSYGKILNLTKQE